MVCDYDFVKYIDNVLDWVFKVCDVIISYFNWVCIWFGVYSFGLYVYNDIMCVLGCFQDMFSDLVIFIQLIFVQWIQNVYVVVVGSIVFNVFVGVSEVFNGFVVVVGGKVVVVFMLFGIVDFMVYYIYVFMIYVMVLILLKGVLYVCSFCFIFDKVNLGFCFFCDGFGCGGICQVFVWDYVFLGLFWMYNFLLIVIFYFFWKMQSDIWGMVNVDGFVVYIINGNFV